MPESTDAADAKKHFLDAKNTEIVHGPEVIAEQVSGAMEDADRFGLPRVKPPLAEALDRTKGAVSGAAGEEPAGQDTLTGVPAGVDEKAGSAEVLKPTGKDPA